jgi:antitoxin component YwqK of YwqJK toxin-antitoxin module
MLEFYPTGKIMERSQYVNNQLNGEVIKYAEDGKIKDRLFFKDGEPALPPPAKTR